LMPSIQEAFGLMAVESMACGTPVIAFEGTSLPEVIKAPSGGICVPAQDAVTLAQTIDSLMKNPALRAMLSKSARDLCEREYSYDLYLSRHASYYSEIYESFVPRKTDVLLTGKTR
jgi:glycosyltransferase involved in cell wall biosynthesis